MQLPRLQLCCDNLDAGNRIRNDCLEATDGVRRQIIHHVQRSARMSLFCHSLEKAQRHQLRHSCGCATACNDRAIWMAGSASSSCPLGSSRRTVQATRRPEQRSVGAVVLCCFSQLLMANVLVRRLVTAGGRIPSPEKLGINRLFPPLDILPPASAPNPCPDTE
eukprot:7713041-Pyramimonas_sp.AAC.1